MYCMDFHHQKIFAFVYFLITFNIPLFPCILACNLLLLNLNPLTVSFAGTLLPPTVDHIQLAHA